MAKKIDFSQRDNDALVTFYVPLWKRNSITLNLFDDYWRNVHGPVCSRLPGQFQYWQFHVAHNVGGAFPEEVVPTCTKESDQFDGIAELTFKSDDDRNAWFTASGILMDDEHNLFNKAIGYVTNPGNSITYYDGMPIGDPNGKLDIIRYHVMVRQADGVSQDKFRSAMKAFAESIKDSENVLKIRLHLFEPPNVDRPDAAGVSHYEAPEAQYQAAFEIAFEDGLKLETFLAKEYPQAIKKEVIKEIIPFKERDPYTFVYNGEMTLAGKRGSQVAENITSIGATNQLRDDIMDLMLYWKL